MKSRICYTATVMFLLFSMLISCTPSDIPEQSTESTTDAQPIVTEFTTAASTTSESTTVTQVPSDAVVSVPVISGKTSEYVIIFPNQAPSELKSRIFDFVDAVKQSTGAVLKIAHDKAEVTWAHEIVIGDCNRPEVAGIRSKLRFDCDYAIVYADNRIYIVGGDQQATLDAMDCFVESYIDSQNATLSVMSDLSYYYAESIQFANALEGIYNYCPSVMMTDENTAYIYYCTNRQSYVIIDYIGCRKGTRNADGSWTWGDEFIVLSPTEKAWDEHHTCDPSVIAGSFAYNGEQYSYLMAYLGCDLISNDSQDNKIGLAVAKSPEGPFIKVGSAPFVDFEFQYSPDIWEWGVGQPSIVNIDKQGRVMMFYTRGDRNGTRVLYEEWDLSDVSSPKKLSEGPLSTKGLTNLYGAQDFMNNADFVYDAKNNRYYAISECHPTSFADDTNLVAALQISYCDVGTSHFGEVEWKALAQISKYETGFYSNHNAGFLRDSYGYLSDDFLTVFYTSASKSQELWTFKIHDYYVDVVQ